MLRIITADERLQESGGVKALVLGPAGVGKTSLLRTLEPDTTLFIDLEAGDLSVQDVAVSAVRPKTWPECRDIAVLLSGPNPSLPDSAAYSQAHYDAVKAEVGAFDFDAYRTLFVDSITVAGRLCFRWSQQQPEAHSERNGKPDIRGAYGLHAREMIGWLTHLQHARGKNVVFVGILEKVVDDFNVGHWQLQVEGSKTGREIPGIVDQVITMQFVDFGDGNAVRALVTAQPNDWSYPAKDRSGRLEPLEPPHLGKLFAKIAGDRPDRAMTTDLPAPVDTSDEANETPKAA